MSQLTKYVKASEFYTYMFDVALDRIPDPDEKQDIKTDIRDAMEGLGVPREQVAVRVFKSDVPPQLDTAEDEDPLIDANFGYLLCLLVRNEPGVLQQDPDEISREAVEEFAIFSGLEPEQIRAIVVENAFLEVKVQERPYISWSLE